MRVAAGQGEPGEDEAPRLPSVDFMARMAEMTPAPTPATGHEERDISGIGGHPRGLTTLFFTDCTIIIP